MPSTTSHSTRRQFLMVCPTCCLAVARDRSNLESMESLTMPWSPRDCPKNIPSMCINIMKRDIYVIHVSSFHSFHSLAMSFIPYLRLHTNVTILYILAEWNPRSYLCLLMKRQRILALRWISILHFSWMCALFFHIHNYTTHIHQYKTWSNHVKPYHSTHI